MTEELDQVLKFLIETCEESGAARLDLKITKPGARGWHLLFEALEPDGKPVNTDEEAVVL